MDPGGLALREKRGDALTRLVPGPHISDAARRLLQYQRLARIATAQQCVTINNAAASQILQGAMAQLGPIQQATADLKKVASNIATVQQIANVAIELTTAVASVATAVAAPTVAGIAAAAAAVGTVVASIVPPAPPGAGGTS